MFCKQAGIIHHTTPPYWAQANGKVESQNRSINKTIKIAVLKNLDYKKELFDYLLMYHATPHSVTVVSPAELIVNRKLKDKLPSLKNCVEVPEIRDRDSYQKALSTERSSAIPHKGVEIGDEVLIKRPFTLQKADSKFEENTGVTTAVNGPIVSIQTLTRTMSIKRHKNQIEAFERSVADSPTTSFQAAEASAPLEKIAEKQSPSVEAVRPSRVKLEPSWQKYFVMSLKKFFLQSCIYLLVIFFDVAS